MIPFELTLKNFMCYRGEQAPLKFEGLHTTCLSGENGAGKSALLDAITWALWGKARLSDDDGLIAQGEYEMLVDLTFWLNQDLYRVIRRRQRAGSGKKGGTSSLDFQLRDGQKWKILGGTIPETKKVIESVLRMNYDTFINASFFIQGRADEFTRKTPGERKQVLADILDLQDYELLEERAKERSKPLKEQLEGLAGVITMLRQQSEKQSLYETLVAEGEKAVTELTTHLGIAEAEKDVADEEVRNHEAMMVRRKAIAQQIATLQTDIARQEQEKTTTLNAMKEAEKLVLRQDEIASGLDALEQARTHLAHLDSLRPRHDELQTRWRTAQDAIKDAAREIKSTYEGLNREIARSDERLAQRPDIEARIATLTAQLTAIEPLANELVQVRQQRNHLDEQISQGFRLLQEYQALTNSLAQHQQTLTTRKGEYQRLVQRLEQQLAQVDDWNEDLKIALEQQETAQTLSQDLASLRSREQTLVQQVEEYRAHCTRFKQQADEIKKRQELLHTSETTTCPLCQSHLGEDGLTTIAQHYEQEIVSLRKQYSDANDSAKEVEKKLNQLRQEIGSKEQQLTQAQKQAARFESLKQQLEQAEQWGEELEQARGELETIETTLASESYEPEIRQQQQQIEADLLAMGAQPQTGKKQHGLSLDHLEKERTALAEKQSNLEKHLEGQATLEKDLGVFRHQIEELDGIEATVPDLRRQAEALATTLANNDFAHDIRQSNQEIENEIAALGYTTEAHQQAQTNVKQLSHWHDESHQLEVARTTIERDARTIQRIDEIITRYQQDETTLRTEDSQIEEQLRHALTAQQQAKACAERVADYRRRLTAATNDLTEKQVLLKSARQAAAELAHTQDKYRALAEQQSIFEELAEACGKKGVQAMLIETAIPEIEQEANRLLGQMTGNQMHVAFDMQKSTKKGTVQETLQITISDALGTRDYSAFSGGEAMRINFAIRIALSRLLARRAGASLETLIIDEGFGALDVDGRERFVEAITSIQNDFKCILVISHIEDLKDKFPTQIHVTKGANGSTWEVLA